MCTMLIVYRRIYLLYVHKSEKIYLIKQLFLKQLIYYDVKTLSMLFYFVIRRRWRHDGAGYPLKKGRNFHFSRKTGIKYE